MEASETTGELGLRMADVANAMVKLQKELHGRGPEQARAHMSGNMVVCLLEGGRTRGEQSLLDAGENGVVEANRKVIQHVMEERARESVEQITGRTVRSFMSANDPEADLQVEIFVLEREL